MWVEALRSKKRIFFILKCKKYYASSHVQVAPVLLAAAPGPACYDCGASERVWETGWRAGSCVRRCLLLLCLALLSPYLGFVVVRVLRSPASRPAQRRLSGAAACAAAAPLRCVAFTSPTTSDTQAAHPESTLAPGVMVPRSRR